MLSAVRCLLSKLVSPLWKTVEEEKLFADNSGTEDVRHLRGCVVTQICLDHGMIDDAIFFTFAEVLGGLPLAEGDVVNCIAVRGGAECGWKALRVEKNMNEWDDGRTSQEADSMQLRNLIGTVSSFDGNGGHINQNTFFPLCSLSEGYVPMKGDWVQAKYFLNPTQWTIQAHYVAPLRYSRLDRVPITSTYGDTGVVDNRVFFYLDSLLLPTDYQPAVGHLVNLVMVESNQSLYAWRALCLAPCTHSGSSQQAATPLRAAELQELLENKGGLDVTTYSNFGNLMVGQRSELVLWIQNKNMEAHTLEKCELAGWDSGEQFTIVSINKCGSARTKQQTVQEDSTENQFGDAEELGVGQDERIVEIPPGGRVSVEVSCEAKILGSCSELLLLNFSSFTIGRCLEVSVDSEDMDLVQPSGPYSRCDVRHKSGKADQVITVIPAKISRSSRRRLPNFLPNYLVPQNLRECVDAKADVLVIAPCLGELLSPENMYARFSHLIWLEELHLELELREFFISGALLKKGSTYLQLELPGLAEGRPNVTLGDKVLMKKMQLDGLEIEYVGFVTEIQDETISLRVNSEFHRSYIGEPLDVEFCLNRLTLRRCHNALIQAKHFRDMLFPSKVILQPPQFTEKWVMDENPDMDNEQEESDITTEIQTKATQTKDRRKMKAAIFPRRGDFFNRRLNPKQKEAVIRIMEGECRPIPYVLFGPPGTGKTLTLIEAILQIHYFLPGSRLLICTPSNSAADLICIRLHNCGFLETSAMARVNASCRDKEVIPDELQIYSKAGEDIRQAAYHRIVICTCSSAAMFNSVGINVGHFTHVFLDEAGQATEPEALIPISYVSEKDGQIVLAGDPCQLGPIVKSRLALAFGLGLSLLERLMLNPLYSKHSWGYNPKLVTKLIYNYRSHVALLALPSKLFYSGELCFKGPKSVVESLSQWKNLPKKGFPLVFHGVRGTEMREGRNPSYFNPVEAVQVMLYCCQLAKKLYKPVHTSDIGIIAPYRKQCEKIRLLLAKVGLADIKVGSVEEFQGQEYLVIIVTTVRSHCSSSETEGSNLGFLTNPKRFNVAITRPKALLIVVGNPHVLIEDSCYNALLQYSFSNGAYIGCDPPLSLHNSHSSAEEPN